MARPSQASATPWNQPSPGHSTLFGPGSKITYPEAGVVKTMTVDIGVRNRRKHPIYVTGAKLRFKGARLEGVRNLEEPGPTSFTLGMDGEVSVEIRREIEAGKLHRFHFEVDLDDEKWMTGAQVIVESINGSYKHLPPPGAHVTIREFSPRKRVYEIS
jgi:hypothetical protein